MSSPTPAAAASAPSGSNNIATAATPLAAPTTTAAAAATSAPTAPVAAGAPLTVSSSANLPFDVNRFEKQTYAQMKDWMIRLDPTFGDIERRVELERLAKRAANFTKPTQWKILKCWSSFDVDELAGFTSLTSLRFMCTVRGLGGACKSRSDALEKLIAFSQPGDAQAIERLGAGASCDMDLSDSDILRLLLTAGHSSNKDHITALVKAKSTGGAHNFTTAEWLDAHSNWVEITLMFLKKEFQPPNPLEEIIDKSGYEYEAIDDQVLNVGTAEEVQQELDDLDPSVSKWAVDNPRLLPRPVLRKRVYEIKSVFSRILTEARAMEARTAVDRVGTWWQKTQQTVDRMAYAIFFHFSEYEHLQHCRPSRVRMTYLKVKPVLRMTDQQPTNHKKGTDSSDDDDRDDNDMGGGSDDALTGSTPAGGNKRARTGSASAAPQNLSRTFSSTPWVVGAEAEAKRAADFAAAERRYAKRRRAEDQVRRAEEANRRAEDAAKFEAFGEHVEMAFSVLGDRLEAGLLAVGEGLSALARAYGDAH